jgi:hypothetical protein
MKTITDRHIIIIGEIIESKNAAKRSFPAARVNQAVTIEAISLGYNKCKFEIKDLIIQRIITAKNKNAIL